MKLHLPSVPVGSISRPSKLSQHSAFYSIIPALNASDDLPLSSKTSALDLAQSFATAQQGNGAEDTNQGEGLEEVPAAVVKDESSLNRKNRAKEKGVRDRRSTESLSSM